MKHTLKISLLTLSAVAIGLFLKEHAGFFNDRVDAVGAVNINLGVANGDPIFTFENIAPGYEESHEITVTNGDSSARVIGIKGVKTNGDNNLEDVMEIWITEDGVPVYGGTSMTGPKMLKDFFEESDSLNGVMMSSVSANDATTYIINVKFVETAGNQYQGATLTFDLRFGIVTNIPLACEGIKFAKTIYGTAGNDNLRGTTGNDLIIGFEGSDRVDGGVGHDCIVGGSQASILGGGVGNDVIVGNDGDDRINGGQGQDSLYGGLGSDTLIGGEGKDEIFAGGGNDTIDAGQGSDLVLGEKGNDTMRGGEGVDTLNGGDGLDIADGQQGRDSCSAETKMRCEVAI